MSQRIALVTGGTRGIGRGVVEQLLANRWSVIATGLSEEEVNHAPKDNNLRNVVLDVTDPLEIQDLFSSIERLDGLVNCAGMLARDAEYDIEVFRKIIDVNLIGTMRMCVAAHERMKELGGAIVNTASMLSIFGGPLVPAYSASKGGVAQLTKSLAGKWARDGIRVNAVAPGWIETEMTSGLREDEHREMGILSRTPLQRWGKPAEVGHTVTYLLSEQASFMTGSIITVDGGYSAL